MFGELLCDTRLTEQDESSSLYDLGFVATQTHHIDITFDRLIEAHTRGEHGDEVQSLVGVRIEASLAGGGDGQLQVTAKVGSEALKPDRKVGLHLCRIVGNQG